VSVETIGPAVKSPDLGLYANYGFGNAVEAPFIGIGAGRDFGAQLRGWRT
jgi:hypothetical protein